MKKLLIAAAVMASLVSTQMPAEARGGAGGGSGSGGGSGMMSRMGGDSTGMGDRVRTQQQDRVRTQQQDRVRDPALGASGVPAGDQLGTRQQLRDPSLHTDVISTPEVTTDN